MEINNFGVNFKETNLVNGVKLYSFYKPNSPIYFRVFFYAGSQFDGDKPGLAHFCEHIMISGTEKYPTRIILNEKIQESGIRSNAFTNVKNLWLTFDLADKADLPEMFEIVDQILNKSIFAPETIEKERGAVLAEQTRNTSNPSLYINPLQSSLLFQGTNIENPVLGFDESVRSINREDLLNYRDKYLSNGQVAYFISGDFDEWIVTEYINKINNKRQPIGLVKSKLPIVTEKKEFLKEVLNIEQNYVNLATRIEPIVSNLNKVSADVFGMIFGQGNSSRLYKALRNDRGLVYGVSSGINNNSEFALLGINTSCKVKDSTEVIKIIKDELSKIIKDGISNEELERAKKNILRNLKFDSETSAFWVNIKMMKELTDSPKSILPDEYIEIVKAITIENVNSFIKEYLIDKELLFAGIGDFNSF
jgi:predicted Zn-dependent peptidase